MTRKLMSLALCASMALGSVALMASCADKKPETTTPAANNDSQAFMSKIPTDLNFANMGLDEEALTLNVAYSDSAGDFTRRSLKADELDESDVDIATMARDNRLKEQLGLELYIEKTGEGIGDMESTIGNSLATGAKDWDILAAYQYYGITIARKGYLINLADLASENADYIDLEADYWGKAFNDNMSYQGAYYWITGDIALRYLGGMYCTFVNARLYNELLNNNYGSIYTIAKDGKWTLDLMTEMASACYKDDGTTPGEKDAEDTFGFGWESCDMIDGMALGAGVQWTYKDPSTGTVSISIMTQRTFDVAKKLNTLAKQGDYAYNFGNNDSTIVMPAFASGTVAFTVNKVFQAEAYLADMEDDYYIIPAPKFDETQINYITGLHDGCTIFGITYCTDKIPQAAAALEFLCAYSSKDVKPLYYEGALKGRYTRDPEAAAMIDLIHENITTDFAVAWGNSLNNIPHLFRECSVLNQNNIKRSLTAWNQSLATLTEELAKYVNGGVEAE